MLAQGLLSHLPGMTPENDSPRFLTTRWTMVLPGHGEDSRAKAWDHVCRTYWYPVYAFIRRRGTLPEDASDLTQGFFAKLIGQDWLSQVERRETRFSTLLITILKNYLIKQHRREAAQKRGGGQLPVPLDFAEGERWFGQEPASNDTPEVHFEKRWALAVMDAALLRLDEESAATGKSRLFAALSPFLSREPEPGDYEAASRTLGILPRSVAVAVHRMRQDFRAMVKEEVAAGLKDPTMVQEEMRALAAALGT